VGKDTLAYKNIKLKKVLSSSIIPAIKSLLDKKGKALSKLDGFAIGLGPGSFTSLRVGLSTIKGLATALNKPVVGISSLDVLAMNINAKDKRQICTICDAHRQLVYCCLFRRNNGQLKRKSSYMLISADELLLKIKEPTVFIGDGINLYRENILMALRKKNIEAEFCEVKLWYPQAKQLAILAAKRFTQNKTDSVDSLVPQYLYPKDCQVRK